MSMKDNKRKIIISNENQTTQNYEDEDKKY